MSKSIFEKIFGPSIFQRPAQPTNGAPPITCGIVEQRGDLYLCMPDSDQRGVKLVTLTMPMYDRYEVARSEWVAIQDELRALPQSLRPRRKRSAVRVRVEEQA